MDLCDLYSDLYDMYSGISDLCSDLSDMYSDLPDMRSDISCMFLIVVLPSAFVFCPFPSFLPLFRPRCLRGSKDLCDLYSDIF